MICSIACWPSTVPRCRSRMTTSGRTGRPARSRPRRCRAGHRRRCRRRRCRTSDQIGCAEPRRPRRRAPERSGGERRAFMRRVPSSRFTADEQARLVEAALDDVAVGAGVEAALPVRVAGTGAEDQHRDVGQRRVGPDRLGQREAVHVGHLDIGEDEVARRLGELRQRFVPSVATRTSKPARSRMLRCSSRTVRASSTTRMRPAVRRRRGLGRRRRASAIRSAGPFDSPGGSSTTRIEPSGSTLAPATAGRCGSSGSAP